MFKAENIQKSFADKQVLKGINLTIQNGEVYGLVGANGAGKTTLFNILAQILQPNEGRVFVDEKQIRSANDLNQNIGYIVDIPAMFEYMTAYEYLDFLMSPLKLSKQQIREKSDFLLQAVGLKEVGNKRIKTFSRGMKQRMGIASGLVSNPKVILMDEPSSALDPEGRVNVINIIQSLKKQGKVVLLSTHILTDVERVCDRVGLLVKGSLLVEGKIEDVLSKYAKPILRVETKEIDKVKAGIKTLKRYIVSVTENHSGLDIEFKQGKQEVLFKQIVGLDIAFEGIYFKKPTIEEVFIEANKEVSK